MSAAADGALLRMVSGAEIEGWELPLLRLREVEIHHVDLAAGYALADWPADFAPSTLDQVTPGFAAREGMPFGRLVDDDRPQLDRRRRPRGPHRADRCPPRLAARPHRRIRPDPDRAGRRTPSAPVGVATRVRIGP